MSGLDAQVGFIEEATYGTPLVVDRFLPFLSENIQDTYGRVEAEDILAGGVTQHADAISPGNVAFAGPVVQYLMNEGGQAKWWEMLLGTNVTAGAGPFTHTATPGAWLGDSMTVQVGRPDQGGTVNPFTYEGVKIVGATVSVTSGDNIAQVSWDIDAENVLTATSLEVASFPATLHKYAASEIGVTIGGSSVCVRNLELNIQNAFADRYCLGSAQRKEPDRNDHMQVTGSLEIEWTDLTNYDLVRNYTAPGAATELVITATSGTDTWVATMDCDWRNAQQPVQGRGDVFQTIDFKAVGAATDADTITIVTTNDDSAA